MTIKEIRSELLDRYADTRGCKKKAQWVSRLHEILQQEQRAATAEHDAADSVSAEAQPTAVTSATAIATAVTSARPDAAAATTTAAAAAATTTAAAAATTTAAAAAITAVQTTAGSAAVPAHAAGMTDGCAVTDSQLHDADAAVTAALPAAMLRDAASGDSPLQNTETARNTG
jgi:hypothetical protein